MLRNKSWVLLLALVLLVTVALAGCGGQKPQPADSGSSTKAPEKAIVYNLGAEPETLEPAMQIGAPEGTVLMALMEGLYRYNADRKLVPGAAEKVDISPDGKKYIFTIRKGMKWTNGDPVTAHDFEYAWKYLLDKNTAADYAYLAYCIKNGEKFNNGEVTADQVGVKATDDYTLEVELEAPTPYFLDLTACSNLFPVNKKVAEANKEWHTRPETYVGNGPFKLAAWEHQQKLELVKNPDYWDAANVKLDKLTIILVEDVNTMLTMFESGQIDVAEDAPVKDVKRLLADGTAVALPDPSTYYYILNTKKKPLDNVKVRQALSMVIDRKAIVENVTRAGQKPATGYVPFGFPDLTPDKDFREAGGALIKEDVNKAKKLLAEAGYPDGKGMPEIEILYNNSPNHQKIAEAIAQMWKDNLGIKVKLAAQEWQVYLDALDAGNFMVARGGWMPDYNDAMTFMDVHVTGGGNNHSFWSNKEYDRLIAGAKNTNDQNIRIKNMHEAERILMDEMPVIPIYFYVNVTMYKPWVKGVFVPPFGGYQEFKWADVEGKK
ncbi:peptide ABC transporter substrate-binding protein [Desulfallas sp. Bu1-1]|uniref:peptide ABC transporter substrate-binding protein n=1 Tax=Desulfallas sp. Bu1-1 TaxID=2787620 RepID=UPI00189DB86D|nr:peptide ABC transporter substrate-binding protein [Desulfallas sp. Bu1-1]MBF7084021.1 peptide ABC transporter substrate-binding protein [Desulfallas sp. Bu1-1]